MNIQALIQPLSYQYKPQVIAMTTALDMNVTSLRPIVGDLMDSRGMSQRLLYFTGTIPVTIRGVTYHLPINIWIPLAFPQCPPTCYLTPTATMYIKPRHQHVDLQGMIYLPYLHGWNASSTLTELITWMTSVFERDCPVLSKAPAPMPVQPPPPQPTPQAHMWPGAIPIARPIQNGAQAVVTASPGQGDTILSRFPQQQQPIVTLRPPPPPPQPVLSQRQILTPQVTDKLRTHLRGLYQRTAEEIDCIFAEQNKVAEGTRKLDNSVRLLAMEKTALTAMQQQLEQDITSTQAWLAENESKEEVEVEQLVYPKDTWTQQLLEAVAEDHAIQDTMDELQNALRNDRLDIVVFLKQIRHLARKQFMVRALALKIHQSQQQQQRGLI